MAFLLILQSTRFLKYPPQGMPIPQVFSNFKYDTFHTVRYAAWLLHPRRCTAAFVHERQFSGWRSIASRKPAACTLPTR